MDLDALRQAGQFLLELVSPRDFESHQGNLPGSGRGAQGLLEPTDVEYENSQGTQFRRPPHGHRAHQAAVEKMFAPDFHGGEKARDGARCEHGVSHRPGREPMCGGPFYRGGHAFESDVQIRKTRALAQPFVEQPP
jgi:hypothetical protein